MIYTSKQIFQIWVVMFFMLLHFTVIGCSKPSSETSTKQESSDLMESTADDKVSENPMSDKIFEEIIRDEVSENPTSDEISNSLNEMNTTHESETNTTDDSWVSPQAFTKRFTFRHDGHERHYFLHIPDNLPNGAPLVIVMHGYTGNASHIMEYSGLNQVANENRFVVAYPQGLRDHDGQHFFNVGYDFHTDDDSDVDDLGFIKALVTHLQETYSLSHDNVFATGMSNGGDMSYLLACEASDVFKAIAPVAGMILESIYNTCTPENPMPVFEIHGTQDYVTYWDGDINNEDGWGAYLDIPTMMNFWVTLNGLELYDSIDLEDSNTNDGSMVVFERYWSDSTVHEVWLYKVVGGGHDWPGANGNMDVNVSTDIWRFFSKFIDN